MSGGVPPELLPACVDCGEPTDPEATGVLFGVRGWIEDRGAAGGVHHVIAQERTGELMCSGCALAFRSTGRRGQATLV